MADAGKAEIEDLKKKLSQNPDSLIFVPLADAYRKAGMLDEAIEVCKTGLEKHPMYTSARVVLGRIYNEKNMLDEAITELKKVESTDIDNIMVHAMLGDVYLKKKIYAEAIEQFQRVLSLNPEDFETQEKLQKALSARQDTGGKEEEGEEKSASGEKEEEPEKKEKKGPDIQKAMKAAGLYTKKEEFDKAIEIYKEILDTDPENIIVQQRLREVYDFQEKKSQKEKTKIEPASPGKKVDINKITTEDILDVMKEAVEDDSVEEEEKEKAEKEEAEKKERAALKKEEEEKEEQEKKEKEEKQKKEEEKPGVKTDEKSRTAVEKVLKGISDVDGVAGSFFLLRDGNIFASALPSSINTKETGKYIASIVNRTEQSVKTMDQGKLNQVVISSEAGQLLFTEVAGGVLFMIGNENINVGKMRLILGDAIDNIKNILL